MTVLVEVVRSGFVESVHRGSVIVLDADGAEVAAAGEVDRPIFPRSANKPMQATGMLRAGLTLADPADLAIVAASHTGQALHVVRVRRLLAAGGLTEDQLACPPGLPVDEEAFAEVLRNGSGPARALYNCSGKHAGMLHTCLAAGWPTAGYERPDHPLQRDLRAAVEDLASMRVTAVGVDGCGAPVFALSLRALAAAFLRVVHAAAGTHERTVADAMRANPEVMSGTGQPDAVFMRAVPGLLAKGGAEGVHVAAVPGVGAVAVKIDDGAPRAAVPASAAALRRLGVPAPDELAESAVYGGGRRVGTVRAVWA